MLPALKNHRVVANFAGLRPASDKPHDRVEINDEQNWITVGGIRSTGLTSALGLAKHIYSLHSGSFEPKKPSEDVEMTNITELQPRDHEKAGFEKMVCHCEHVTDREIQKALKGECGAGTMGGLKRRTRATMGRCQGFNCISNVTKLCMDEESSHE